MHCVTCFQTRFNVIRLSTEHFLEELVLWEQTIFGLTVAETFKYWTAIETLLSILGLAGVLLASLIT